MTTTPIPHYFQRLNELGKEKKPFAFLIDFECESPLVWLLEDNLMNFHFSFNGVTNKPISTQHTKSLVLNKYPETFQQYQDKFNKVHQHISRGDSFLVNLTSSTKIEIDLNLEEIYLIANAKYKCWLENEFVCFSPETFIKIKDQKIRSFPMKGTIDASLPNAKEMILSNLKEAAEHATIVDLIRNDLSKVSSNVRVTKYRYYEEIKTHDQYIGQVSSEISGDLSSHFNEKIGTILWSLLPAGSVSGAPKKKTIEIIRQTEENNRGYYCGVAGYFDGEVLDSCVLIRFLQANHVYRSGGGITFLSNAADEYKEMIDKIYVPIY